mmetsp:Transcript_6815/g.15551  ORF Transcript_6815/g.15551 Transcript_6815/m.15551 type:complete len:1095 (-) Transcript_6815:67-3351(-)
MEEESEIAAGKHDADAPADNSEESADESDDMIDIINKSLVEILTKVQEEVDATMEVAAKKREEADAIEADAEEKVGKMNILREQAQSLADDDTWQTMYHRLRDWSKEKGHCNPRRNWKAKIDAEEKALGNWSGKQRREEKQGKLNPFKKTSLEHLKFTFGLLQAGWDDFHKKLKEHVSKHGKLPENLEDLRNGFDVYTRLRYYRRLPRAILGLIGKSAEFKNETFTQEKIDILTECGLNWMLDRENVNALKEKGLIFPMPVDEEQEDMEKGNIPALVKHHWLLMYETLVQFKKKHGHTYVTPFNSSPEFYHWICQQRKRMQPQSEKKKKSKDIMLLDYQADMLLGIDFVYSKADVDWMDNYERLSAYKRLTGVAALVTDKFCDLSTLEQWVEDNKRQHLNIPLLEHHDSVSWARVSEAVTIPIPDRKKLLDDIGVFEVAIGQEEKEVRKSHYFFRTTEQVASYEHVLRSRVEKKVAEMLAKGPFDLYPPDAAPQEDGLPTKPAAPSEASYKPFTIDPETEREFFLKRGAIVAASVEDRQALKIGGKKSSMCHSGRKFYDDGRPIALCRISNCFSASSKTMCNFLCVRHFRMIEGFATCEAIKTNQSEDQNKKSETDEASEGNGGLNNPDQPKTIYSCSYCENSFDLYDEAIKHEKNCGTVEEATAIPFSGTPRPTWRKPSIHSNKITGEAKTLAEDYSNNVWKLALDYRKKSANLEKNANKFISSALGEERRLKPNKGNNFRLPGVKFPSMDDELESVKLFRRCCGPLAATISGRNKLIKDELIFYGDGRPLSFCRVAGCQMVHSESTTEKKFLCDWHFASIQRPTDSEIVEVCLESGETRKRKSASEEAAFTRARKATKKFSSARDALWNGTRVTVVAPAGTLDIALKNCLLGLGTFVTFVGKVLEKQISPGDRIIAIDGEDVSRLNVKEVKSIMARKIGSERRLRLLKGTHALPSSETPKKAYASKPSIDRSRMVDGLLFDRREYTNMSSAPAQNNASTLPFASASKLVREQNVTLPTETGSPKTQHKSLSIGTVSVTKPIASTGTTVKPATQASKKESPPSKSSSSALTSEMAMETPLEPADSDIRQFMGC